MDQRSGPSGRRRRGALAAALATAVVAVALPASGALAGAGSDAGSPGSPPAALDVQQSQGQQRGEGGSRDRDCPEKGGGADGRESGFDQAPEGSIEL